MEDMERYGDYNEIEDAPSKSKVLLAIKILVALAILFIAAILGYRIFLYNYYPGDVADAYVDERLTSLYELTDGHVGAKTQELRVPYDDAQIGSLFCDNLIVIDALGRVQITVRYNFSAIEYMEQKYGISGLEPTGDGIFEFALYRNDPNTKEQFKESDKVGTLVAAEFTTYAMYGYYKLVFDDIDLDGDDTPAWLALAVSVKDSGANEPFGKIVIYENSEDFARFKDYKITENDLKK